MPSSLLLFLLEKLLINQVRTNWLILFLGGIFILCDISFNISNKSYIWIQRCTIYSSSFKAQSNRRGKKFKFEKLKSGKRIFLPLPFSHLIFPSHLPYLIFFPTDLITLDPPLPGLRMTTFFSQHAHIVQMIKIKKSNVTTHCWSLPYHKQNLLWWYLCFQVWGPKLSAAC